MLRIFDETVPGGSAAQIRRDLDADGIPAPRGGKWSRTLRQTPDVRIDAEIPVLRIVPTALREPCRVERAIRARTDDAKNPAKARRTGNPLSGRLKYDVWGGP